MATVAETVNPRHLRERYNEWVGRRVTVGTTKLHYLCGEWKAIDESHAVFRIGEHEMRVRLSEIATILDAPAWQPDFFK